ncbi:hypothetical protein [Streptomyces sp. NPDC058304]|uniref:hypothetical protein n=1 Tax=Streptomyces sp. NPDC058304 TaxID=3346437 RepID=UPI0036E4E356
MAKGEGNHAGRNRRRLRGRGGHVAALVLSGALALTACGSDKSGSTESKEPVERHTVVLEAISDYGRPMEIHYFGHAQGPKGMVLIGEKDKGQLSAESPWKVTLTVDGKEPWVSLMVNGTGCIGRAIGGDSCETGSIPRPGDFSGTGTSTCRITIDGKVVKEKSYTYPTIVPVNCLASTVDTPGEGQ